LPLIVLWLAVWYVRRETAAGGVVEQIGTGRIIYEKFPIFVLGFILMFALASTGLFTPKMIPSFREWLTWLFAFGLTGLGMQITIAAMRQAGGEPLVIGSVVGVIKAVLSLIVVLLFIRGTV
jgi:Predicted membrane protein